MAVVAYPHCNQVAMRVCNYGLPVSTPVYT